MVVVRHAEGSPSTVVVALHGFDARYAVAALDMVVWQLRGFELDMAA